MQTSDPDEEGEELTGSSTMTAVCQGSCVGIAVYDALSNEVSGLGRRHRLGVIVLWVRTREWHSQIVCFGQSAHGI